MYKYINSNEINLNVHSKISLKIKGIGENTILGNGPDYYFNGINFLKKVYINNIQQNTIEYKYKFTETDNFVELIWDDNLNSCEYILYRCTEITAINLSNFNTLHAVKMNSMFNYCSSLTSLDLSNFNTPKVSFMNSMFFSCKNLEYININNFDKENLSSNGALIFLSLSIFKLYIPVSK